MGEKENEAAEVKTACPKCGAGLVNIPSGSVCPRGCAGLHAAVPSDANRAARKALKVEGLMACRVHASLRFRKRGQFADCELYVSGVGDQRKFWRRVARKSSALKAAEAHELARDQAGRVVELVEIGL